MHQHLKPEKYHVGTRVATEVAVTMQWGQRSGPVREYLLSFFSMYTRAVVCTLCTEAWCKIDTRNNDERTINTCRYKELTYISSCAVFHYCMAVMMEFYVTAPRYGGGDAIPRPRPWQRCMDGGDRPKLDSRYSDGFSTTDVSRADCVSELMPQSYRE